MLLQTAAAKVGGMTDDNTEPLLCAYCGDPIATERAKATGYHPWCVEQIEDDIAMEDVR